MNLFDKTAVTVALQILDGRAGIARNGSTLDAKGENAFKAVTGTEVARAMQDSALAHGSRWKNCNHATVGRALSAAGFQRVYSGGKAFFLRSYPEALRLQTATDADRRAERDQEKARREAREASHAAGKTFPIRIRYASAQRSWRTGTYPTRTVLVRPEDVLTEAAAIAKKPTVSVVSIDSWYGGWSWRR